MIRLGKTKGDKMKHKIIFNIGEQNSLEQEFKTSKEAESALTLLKDYNEHLQKYRYIDKSDKEELPYLALIVDQEAYRNFNAVCDRAESKNKHNEKNNKRRIS